MNFVADESVDRQIVERLRDNGQRPLKNAQFCSSSRKAKILTTPIKSGQASIH